MYNKKLFLLGLILFVNINLSFGQELIAVPEGQLNRNIASLAREAKIPLYVVDTILTDVALRQNDFLRNGRIGRWGLTQTLINTPTRIDPNDERACAIRVLAYVGSLYDTYNNWTLALANYLDADVNSTSAKIELVQMLRGER